MKNCSSGEDQSRTCLKCCAPSNSMMILYSGIQKSKGRWSSLLHPSCLDSSNGWDLVKGIANYFPEKFLAILEEVFPIVTSTAKNADVTKEVLAIEVRFDTTSIANLSLPTSTPKKPCSHCGQQQWSWTCPMRSYCQYGKWKIRIKWDVAKAGWLGSIRRRVW